MYEYTVNIWTVANTWQSAEELMLWTVALEKILERSLDYQDIKLVNPKINRSWIFIGRTDAEAEAPICWPPDAKGQRNGKDPDAGNTEGKRRERQRMRWLDGITNSLDVIQSKPREMLKDREGWSAAVHGVTKSQTWLRDWSELSWTEDHREGSFMVEGGLSSSGAERICLFEHRATCLQVITSQLLLPVWGNSTIFFLGFLLVCSSCFSSFLHM